MSRGPIGDQRPVHPQCLGPGLELDHRTLINGQTDACGHGHVTDEHIGAAGCPGGVRGKRAADIGEDAGRLFPVRGGGLWAVRPGRCRRLRSARLRGFRPGWTWVERPRVRQWHIRWRATGLCSFLLSTRHCYKRCFRLRSDLIRRGVLSASPVKCGRGARSRAGRRVVIGHGGIEPWSQQTGHHTIGPAQPGLIGAGHLHARSQIASQAVGDVVTECSSSAGVLRTDQPICRVVGVLHLPALGIGAAGQVVRAVIGIKRLPVQGIRDDGQPIQRIVGVPGDRVPCIGDLLEVVVRIGLIARDPSERILHGEQSIRIVIGIARGALLWIGETQQAAGRVVRQLDEPTQRVCDGVDAPVEIAAQLPGMGKRIGDLRNLPHTII